MAVKIISVRQRVGDRFEKDISISIRHAISILSHTPAFKDAQTTFRLGWIPTPLAEELTAQEH